MRNELVRWNKTEREIANALGYCKYLSGVKEFKDSKERFKIGCGERCTFVFAYEDNYRNHIDICYKHKEMCRAFCFLELQLLGYEPQSYWDTEQLQLLYKCVIQNNFNAISCLNDLISEV